jgi:hypothetical protein
MDRYDEKRDSERNDTDEVDARQGDILGLGGASVPKAPDDPVVSNDPESVRKRRERAAGTGDAAVRHEDPDRQRSGATGIDMGSGGQGTHVSGD